MKHSQLLGLTSSALLLTTAMSVNAAQTNPFSSQTLPQGYMQVASSHAESKCGEGKCGENKAKKALCDDMSKECEHKMKQEAKCGEGKCGSDKKSTEAKCGEGKCGSTG